ncbi:hypothetical protein KY332_04665 [Candidatus Woesearchaeota archaeon]|nr:hypothetical protein [Candidatus Woesearchaeota archaeon]
MTNKTRSIEELLKENPILQDSSFVGEYPNIISIAEFIEEIDISQRQFGHKHPHFKDLEINDISEYLRLLEKGNKKAIELYKKILNDPVYQFSSRVKEYRMLIEEGCTEEAEELYKGLEKNAYFRIIAKAFNDLEKLKEYICQESLS